MSALMRPCSPALCSSTWAVTEGRSVIVSRCSSWLRHSVPSLNGVRSTASDRIVRNGGASSDSSSSRRPIRASTCCSSSLPRRPPAANTSLAYPGVCNSPGSTLTAKCHRLTASASSAMYLRYRSRNWVWSPAASSQRASSSPGVP